MDAQRFIAEFGHIANAPGGVTRLRELVLQLATSGDLIETNIPVSAMPLLEAIWRRKEAHPEQKKVVSKQSRVPYGLVKAPAHWAICRLGDLTLTITGGGTPSKNNPAYWGGAIPWASVKDLKDQKYIDSTEDYITEEGLRNSSSNLIPINRVIVCTRMGLGKIAINRVELAINQDLKALELPPEVNPDFFFILYKTRDVKGTGTTVSGIKQDQLLALPAALPPTEEQSRIVTKVDELMALCDKLEAQQKSRHQLQTALRQSTLKAVAAATSPDELKIAWMRLSENFSHLFAAPEDVDDLEQSIKKLALMGLITSTEPGEAISESLALRAESTAPVDSMATNWKIPSHWLWAKCSWLGEARLGKMLDASKNKGELKPYLRNVNVRWRKIDLHNVLQIRVEKHELPRISVKRDDLIICEGGEPGRAAIWDCDEEFVIQKALHRFRCGPDVAPGYILFCLEHDYFSGRLARYYTGATIKHLTGKSLAEYLIPLPPLNEQRRILSVAKRISSVIADLKKQLQGANQCGEMFALSSVASIAGITIAPTQDAPMKAPKTELSAPLRSGKKPTVKDQAPLATILTRQQGGLNAKDLWQRYGGEIDAFYAQLKTEVANGWIQEPEPAMMNEIFESASA